MTRRRSPHALPVLVAGLAAALLLAVPVQSQGPGNSQGLQIGLHRGYPVAAGEVLVKLREHARFAAMPADLDVDRDEPIGDGSVRRVRSRSHSVETLLARLSESADVEYVEPNYIVYAINTPSEQAYRDGLLWGLDKISAPAAWDRSTGSAASVVAVVDTGIDYNHPDLAANVWGALGKFSVTVGGVTVTCDAGTHGFNAIRKTCDPMDDNDHGTHVSGTIGAKGNNGVGVVGVNWTASIMGLKFLNRQGSGSTADAINAIEFAIQAKKTAGVNVRVLSNSWGGGSFSQALLDEIKLANGADILFVASAGNNGRNTDASPQYPAGYNAPNIVSVAATDDSDTLALWSNYGVASVDLAAPGVNIYSTLRGASYGTMSGTSMAAPHVSGAAALVLSRCGWLKTDELKNVLLGYVAKVSALAQKVLSGGRLNVDAAVGGCIAVPDPLTLPDFLMEVTPTEQSASRGSEALYNIKISPIDGFSGDVSLTALWIPEGATHSLSGNPVVYPYTKTATLSVTPGPTTKTSGWTYNIKITATSGALVHSTTVKLKATR
jgi:subtilisin family serine protease